jgi:hypothetical protein
VCPLANGRLHGMCGQRSPRRRLWSRNTASCGCIRAARVSAAVDQEAAKTVTRKLKRMQPGIRFSF